MKLDMQVGLAPGHTVLDGDPVPLSPKGHGPKFSAHICCDRMAGWIKMPLGREVGLGPIDTMLDGDPASRPKKGAQPSIFGPCVLWPTGWMDQDGAWYGGRPLSRRHCAGWGWAPFSRRGGPYPAQCVLDVDSPLPDKRAPYRTLRCLRGEHSERQTAQR